MPDDPFGGDTFAATWWEDAEGLPIGRGRTPDDAVADLVKRLEAIPPEKKVPAKSELGQTMWKWTLTWPSGQSFVVTRMWRGDGRGPVDS